MDTLRKYNNFELICNDDKKYYSNELIINMYDLNKKSLLVNSEETIVRGFLNRLLQFISYNN